MDMCCCHPHDQELLENIKINESTLHIHLIAGSCAGVMEHVSMFPIDTIKTHIQTSKDVLKINEAFFNLHRNGGLLRFWRGVTVIALASVPAHAAYFSAYEFAKKKVGVDRLGFQFISSAIVGGFATLFHDLILTPCDGKFIMIEVIKQRMQLTGSKNYYDSINEILKKEGYFSLYRSLPITLVIHA